ncbi:fumarylacetoacetate hydrolase family protein, partial [Candidatus Marinimicrobia bacterium]|nr:fumarylacetoacetate hydrolase family protein [Candidatus Neomarinimicrobiota bacterium]
MKFATFTTNVNKNPRYGFKKEKYIVDILYLSKFLQEKNDNRFLNLPVSLKEALEDWNKNFKNFKSLKNTFLDEYANEKTKEGHQVAQLESDVNFLAPVPTPPSFRDFYAFEQHVRSARKLRGLDMHPDWFKIPIFYFSNAGAVYGHREPIPYP